MNKMGKSKSTNPANKKKNLDSYNEKKTGTKFRGVFKQRWPEQLWYWVQGFLKWTWDAVWNTLASVVELAEAWATKAAQLVWNKWMKETRWKLVNHHLTQSKNTILRAWVGTLNAFTWIIDTTTWAVTTVLGSGYDSVKDTITRLRDDENNSTTTTTYANNGKRRTNEDIQTLRDMANDGKTVEEMVNVLKRKPNAIGEKLRELKTHKKTSTHKK